LASLDGPGGFRIVMESLIDGLVAVEERVASFLRLSLFAVFVVGIDRYLNSSMIFMESIGLYI
jgi:hypothetical protein